MSFIFLPRIKLAFCSQVFWTAGVQPHKNEAFIARWMVMPSRFPGLPEPDLAIVPPREIDIDSLQFITSRPCHGIIISRHFGMVVVRLIREIHSLDQVSVF